MALRVATGFEFGTKAGWNIGNTGNRILDSIFTDAALSITTSTPKTGSYCLEINSNATTGAVQWGTGTLASNQTRGLAHFWVRLVATPSANVRLAQWHCVNADGILWYDQATGKLAVDAGSGTLVDGPAVSAGVWYRVELYYDISANPFTLDWWVDGVSYTQSTFAQTADVLTSFDLGRSVGTQTLNARYDDVALWTDTASITRPVGEHKVVILTVDPAGTLTLSGYVAGDLNTFAGATPTLSAWDATVARDATDEIPLNTGSAQDGWCVITNVPNSAHYVQIPMTSYTLGAGETVAGVRMLAAGWAATTSAATLGFRSWNGSAETTLQAGTIDPQFDNTTPSWVCKMCTLAEFDTQSELDALAFRVGFTADANPDIGIHAIYAETLVKAATAGPSYPGHTISQYAGFY